MGCAFGEMPTVLFGKIGRQPPAAWVILLEAISLEASGDVVRELRLHIPRVLGVGTVILTV